MGVLCSVCNTYHYEFTCVVSINKTNEDNHWNGIMGHEMCVNQQVSCRKQGNCFYSHGNNYTHFPTKLQFANCCNYSLIYLVAFCFMSE